MRYILLIYGDETTLDEPARQACYQATAEVARDLHAKGKSIATSPLQQTAVATSVRVRGGKRMVTDGPFAETREQLGGYMLIDADNLDEAIEVAGRIPGANWGTVEVRPIIELPGLIPDR